MPFTTRCPSCVASLQVPRKLCGRKMFCPRCGQPLVVTSGGTAKRDETSIEPDHNWSGWLPLLALLALTLGAGILALVLVVRTCIEEPVAQQNPAPIVTAERKIRPSPPAPEPQKPAPIPVALLPTPEPVKPILEQVIEPPPSPEPQAPVPPPPPVNLIVNGSFEDGWLNDSFGSGFDPVDSGSIAISGWQVTRGQIDYIGGYWTSADGSQSLDLHGSPGFGGIEQTFPTKAGQRYRVTFAIAGNPDGNVPIKSLGVSAAGQSQAFQFDTTGHSDADMGWRTESWDFVANADQTTIEFYTADPQDGTHGPALDDVRVVAVPEAN